MILCVVFLASCSPSSLQGLPEAASTVTTLPTEQDRIQARISLPRPSRVAFGGGSIWVTDSVDPQLMRIDANTGETLDEPIILDFVPREIAYGEGAVWVCSVDRTRLARIDPQTNEVAAEIDLRSLQIPEHVNLLLGAGEGAVWLTNQTHVIQIDPATNQIVGEPIPAGEEIITLALGHGTLWTGSHDDGIITRVDAKTHSVVATIEMPFSVHGLAVSDEFAWVLDEHGFGVVQIDPQTNRPGERVPIDFVAANLAAGADSVWVAPAALNNGQATGNDGIARIGEDEKEIMEVIRAGDAETSEYYSVYFGEGTLWILVDTPQPSLLQVRP
jgi:DNA-binding beta-propeller fold protein YncE